MYCYIAQSIGVNINTLKSRIKCVRTHIAKEYTRITGIEIEFKKKSPINKNRANYIKKKLKKELDKI